MAGRLIIVTMNDPDSAKRPSLEATFPILGELLYANHAAMSPWPLDTQHAVEAFARENATRGPAEYRRWLRLESGLRQRIARLLNAPSAADISLIRNTTDGICIVAGGLDWRAGDNLVTPEHEFLTNQMAWDALQAEGVEIRRVDIRAAANPEEALLERVDGRTRVLTVSAVQWNDGFRLDLAALGDACRSAGALFFVDAIQQFGALPVDVQACQIDCLSAGSHKWQMGPEGIGVFFCRDEIRPRLALPQLGWHMLDDPYRFERPDRAPSASGRRFEAGSPNTMGQVALDASLEVLERFGQEWVAARVLDNCRTLIEALDDLPGVAVTSSVAPERLSGIVSFTTHDLEPGLVYRRLAESGVLCALRGENIRLSPHFYQHGAPLAAMLDAVACGVSNK